MKTQILNTLLFVLIVAGSALIAIALAAPSDDKCTKAVCRPGTQCRLVRGEPTCECNGTVCTDEWRPVCGSDGNTYPNKCHLSSSACGDTKLVQVAHIGRCIKPPAGRG